MFALTVPFVLALAVSASASQSLSVSASAPSVQTNDVSHLAITTTLTNTGDETLKLLKDPRTPLSSWATETFDVVNEKGVSPDFTGVKVRYVPEVAAKDQRTRDAATLVLAPGQSIDVTHEVGKYFNFTSTGSGSYTFTPLSSFQTFSETGELSTVQASSQPVTIKLNGQLATTVPLSASSLGGASDLRFASGSGSVQKRATYNSNCSSSRQSTNNAAISAAATLATRSVSHLNANPSGSTLQTTWYGTFSSSRRSLTLTAFTRLQTYPAGWRYDCSCTDPSLYAYVYPSSYGTVYLCGYYWNAPATGSGSRADTIIHEGTHFTQVLGTDDYAYGESACKSLAKSNPTNAVYNADNHAFFSDYV